MDSESAGGNCEICGLERQPHSLDRDRNIFTVTCARCGSFEWHVNASRLSENTHQIRLSGYIRDLNRSGVTPLVDARFVATASRLPIPRLPERAMRLLHAAVERGVADPLSPIFIDAQPHYLGASYSAGESELAVLRGILVERQLLEQVASFTAYLVTPSGYIADEESKSPSAQSVTAFVAMSFDQDMVDAYVHGVDPGVQAAGYRPMRIDRKEHANSISDEIMAEIRRARFVVADYTKANNGVYFEAGFAIGLGILVIPTCRKDHLSTLHFDIRHINTLSWESPAELANALAKRISAIIGDGPLK